MTVTKYRASGGGVTGVGLPDNSLGLGGSTFFDYAKSPFYRPLADDAPLFTGRTTPYRVPTGAQIVTTFVNEANREYTTGATSPGFGGGSRSTFIRAPNNTPLITVPIWNTSFADHLRADFNEGIPVPDFAFAGSDGVDPGDVSMNIYSPQMDTLWEFFVMSQRLINPGSFATAVASSGGTIPAGLTVYKITAYNATGETYARASGYQVTVSGSQKVTLDWSGFLTPGTPGTGWRIYRGTSTTPSNNFFLAEVPWNTKTYIDTGAVALDTARKCPTQNTATDTTWRCSWGGVAREVSASPGWFRGGKTHPGYLAEEVSYGESATQIFTNATMITKGDVVRGHIDHSLGIALPNIGAGFIHPQAYAYPCQGSDGRSTLSNPIPYGLKFRFPAVSQGGHNFDTYDFQTPILARLAEHGVTAPTTSRRDRLVRFARMVAKAVQSYGFFGREGSGNIFFYMENNRHYWQVGGRGGVYHAGTPQNPIDDYIYDDGAQTNYQADWAADGAADIRSVFMSLPLAELQVVDGPLCFDKNNPCPRGGAF